MIHVYDNTEGAQGYVVTKDVPADNLLTFEDVGRWAEANHAVDLIRTTWEITLEGKRSSPVEVVNIAVVLDQPCAPPLKGGLVDEGSEGETDKVLLTVNVAAPRPVIARAATLTDPPEPAIPDYFSVKKITLPKGEKNVLVMVGYAPEKYCRWRYRVEYLADGKRGTLTVSAPGGRPFEVTAPVRPRVNGDYRGYDWYVPSLASSCFIDRSGPVWRRPKVSKETYEAGCG